MTSRAESDAVAPTDCLPKDEIAAAIASLRGVLADSVATEESIDS